MGKFQKMPKIFLPNTGENLSSKSILGSRGSPRKVVIITIFLMPSVFFKMVYQMSALVGLEGSAKIRAFR